MSFKRAIELETLTLAILAGTLASIVVWHNNQKAQESPVVSPVIVGQAVAPTAAIVVPTKEPLKQIDTMSQISPDGTKLVSMTVVHNTDKTDTYSLVVNTLPDLTETKIYTATASANSTFSIPFNSWSPDDNYFFVQVNNKNLVFKASGDSFADGQPYHDVNSQFQNSIQNLTLSNVTGWASGTLLVVNTRNSSNDTGPSYWFEIPTQQFTELATLFL